MFIDSHCHLDYLSLDAFDGSLAALLASTRQQGVNEVLSVAVDRKNIGTVAELAGEHINVWASAGIHPLHADVQINEEEVLAWTRRERVVAVGETGLDYHYDTVPRDIQRHSFAVQLRAAGRAGLPVIVHTREAQDDTLRLLRDHVDISAGGVMHCFTESWDVAQQAMDLNFCISFSGIVTFRNAAALRDVARQVPLDRLLIETDAPYLAPVPYRGQQNHPGLLPAVAICLAELRGIPVEALAEHTSANFRRLFSRSAGR